MHTCLHKGMTEEGFPDGTFPLKQTKRKNNLITNISIQKIIFFQNIF